MRNAILIPILLIGCCTAAAVMTSCKKEPESALEARLKRPPPELADVEAHIEELKALGVLRKVDAGSHTAYVKRDLWRLTSFNMQRIAGYAIAHYCGIKNGTGEYEVVFKDSRTKEPLAKWDRMFELRPYPLDDSSP